MSPYPRLLLVWIIGCSVCSHWPSTSRAESLPETVNRHEQQIKALQELVESLKQSVNQLKNNTSPASSDKPPAPCAKVFTNIGRKAYTGLQLQAPIDVNATGIIIKYDKFIQTPPSRPNRLVVASNIDELNNRELESGAGYKFRFLNCGYVLTFESVAPNGLTILLDYQ
jgi:hypothetical protein